MAGEGDAERLVVLLEARIRDFEKNMAKADKSATTSYRRMRRGSKRATVQMERDMARSTGRINQALAATSTKVGLFGKTLVGGLVAGGVAGIITQVGRIAKGIAEVGDEAKRAGVDVESFQELKYVAEQNRIGVDSLTDGLKELNLRADEFVVTGKGSAAEAFERLGFSAEELNRKLKDPSALFTEIIGKLGKLDKAAQIRIADEIFGGTGGEKFVQLIDQGEEGIKHTIDQARDLGQVMSDETIMRAEELDQAFANVSKTVGNELKQAIIDSSWALYDFLQQFQQVENRTTASLENKLRDLGRQRITLENAILRQEAEARKLTGPRAEGPLAAISSNIDELRAKMQSLSVEEKSILDVLSGRTKPRAPTIRTEVGSSDDNGDKPNRSRTKATTDIERQEAAVRSLIAGLEFERSLIGLSEVDQAKLSALREAGAAATGEQRLQIEQLVEQTYAEQQQVEALAATYDLLGQVGETALSGIIDAFEDGKVEGREMLNILSDVLSMAGNFFLRQAFAGFGGGFGGGGLLGGSIIPGILHDGGIAGVDGYGHGRSFAASTWAIAERYHNGGIAGLKPNEVPTILERGERVTPVGANQNHGNDNRPLVQIIDQRRSGTIEQQETIGPNGERQLRAIIRDEVTQARRRGAPGF